MYSTSQENTSQAENNQDCNLIILLQEFKFKCFCQSSHSRTITIEDTLNHECSHTELTRTTKTPHINGVLVLTGFFRKAQFGCSIVFEVCLLNSYTTLYHLTGYLRIQTLLIPLSWLTEISEKKIQGSISHLNSRPYAKIQAFLSKTLVWIGNHSFFHLLVLLFCTFYPHITVIFYYLHTYTFSLPFYPALSLLKIAYQSGMMLVVTGSPKRFLTFKL